MRKRILRGALVGAVAGALALSMSVASAGPSVAITSGSTLLSAPAGLGDKVTGTASFDEAAVSSGVSVKFNGLLHQFTGQANIDSSACAAGTCSVTWSISVPFVIAPGEYVIIATAGQALESIDPDTGETVTTIEEASTSATVTIL